MLNTVSRQLSILLVAGMGVAGLSLSAASQADTTTNATAEHCAPAAYAMALRYQQQSAEVAALQRQSYVLATRQLEQLLAARDSSKPAAIMTDLDETVIDNSALLVRDLKACHDFTGWDTWKAWEREGTPSLIPGAKDFLEYAASKDVTIYYVSDRYEENKDATLATLRALDLPEVDDDHVRLLGPSKSVRRQDIAEDYDIVMQLGDSLHDFSDAFSSKESEQQKALVAEQAAHFGKDWIMLPNASYGSWSKASLTSWDKPLSQ